MSYSECVTALAVLYKNELCILMQHQTHSSSKPLILLGCAGALEPTPALIWQRAGNMVDGLADHSKADTHLGLG